MTTATIGGKKLTFPEGTSVEDMDSAISEYIASQGPQAPTKPGFFEIPSQQQMKAQGSALASNVPFENALPSEQDFSGEQEPSFIEDQLGQMGGSAIGSFQAANKAQQALAGTHPAIRATGTIAAGAAGAFIGGASGKAASDAGLSLVDSSFAPETFKEGAMNALRAGGDEALMDAAVGSAFVVGGGALKLLRPVASESAAAIKNILESGGSNAALDQIIDKGVFKGIARLTRDALIGSGTFKALDDSQDVAIAKYMDTYTTKMTGKALDSLTDEGLGRYVMDVVQDGSRIHSRMAEDLYTQLDQVVPNPTVLQDAPAGIAQNLGAPANQVPVEVGAVDISSIKKLAADKLAKLKAAGDIGKTVEGGELLDKIIALNDKVSFGAAHDIRSDILFRQRGLSSAKSGDPIAANLRDIVSAVDGQMDAAGKTLDPEGLKAYRAANKFYKFGKKNINNKLVKSLVSNEQTPAKVGAALAKTANTDLVRALRRSFRANASVSGKSFKTLWGDVQGGFLGQTLPKTADEVASAPFLKLHKSEKARNSLRGLFTKEQQTNMVKLSEHLDSIVTSRQGKGFLNLKQLGEAPKVLQGIAGGAAIASGGAGIGAGALFLAGPATFAKVATSPKLTNMLIKWSKAPTGNALKAKLGSQLAAAMGLSIADFEKFTGEKVRNKENELIPLR